MRLTLMTIIIFHTRGPNTQENFSYVFDFYVSGDVHIPQFGELKNNFFTSIHFALRVM